MKKMRQAVGQFGLNLADPESSVAVAEEPVTPKATPAAQPVSKPVVKDKVRVKRPAPAAGTVTLHKKGKMIIFKASDPMGQDILEEIRCRIQVSYMRDESYFELPSPKSNSEVSLTIPIYTWLSRGSIDVDSLPITRVLKAYGLNVELSPDLNNYLRKERRRVNMDMAPFPAVPIQVDASLFERCAEGAVLTCTKAYPDKKPQFTAGKRYMVVAAGEEGREVVRISTKELGSNEVISDNGESTVEWTMFSPPMEDFFTDGEVEPEGQNIEALFPAEVEAAIKKLQSKGLKLYKHVQRDAALMSLKRGGLNAYPMRMGKTSFAIACAELWGSQKVGVLVPGNNARIVWRKELDRLGFQEGKDYVRVTKLSDLDLPGKYKIFTTTWAREGKDPEYKARYEGNHYLHPSVKEIKGNQRLGIEASLQTTPNRCPHCKEVLYRPSLTENGVLWDPNRGYVCRNKKCTWETVIPGKGKKKKVVTHHGGFVDYGLAAHAKCEDSRVRTRQCPTCKVTDGTWIPPRYKRFKKRFTLVIPDEIHGATNVSTATAAATYNLRAKRRLGLTGTPYGKDATDIYWPMHYLMQAPSVPFPFKRQAGLKQFDSRFCSHVSVEKKIETKTGTAVKTVQKTMPFLSNPPDFWKFIAPMSLRRVYDDPLYQESLKEAGKVSPKVNINRYPCELHVEQARFMLSTLKEFRDAISKMQKEADAKDQQLNIAMVQNLSQTVAMRLIATCPGAINEKLGKEVYKGPKGGCKSQHVQNLVEAAAKKGEKVLILSDFRYTQSLLAEELKAYNPIQFLTNWDEEKRKEALESFQEDDSKLVFIAGTRAIREAVDLSAANHVICTDLLWSPRFQTQAWSRALAPTDKARTVEIYLMYAAHSLDEHVYDVFYSRLIAAQQAFDRKVVSRRAFVIDARAFVDRILEEEEALYGYLRDQGMDKIIVPTLDLALLEERSL